MTGKLPFKPKGHVYLPEAVAAYFSGRFPNAGLFSVSGDCMSGDDILDGDLVFVDPDTPAVDGDIAAVLVKNRHGQNVLHLRRLANSGWRLETSNPRYETMILTPGNEPCIIGKVVATMRFSRDTEEL